MFYEGEWRPVVKMFQGQTQVIHPERATAAVLEMDDGFIPTLCTPADIMTEWEPELPPETDWARVD